MRPTQFKPAPRESGKRPYFHVITAQHRERGVRAAALANMKRKKLLPPLRCEVKQ